MPRSSSCRARSTGWQSCAETAEHGGGDCGAVAGVLADRARLRPEAQPDAAGYAVAWAGAADLLRAVSDAADPDPGEGRSDQSSRCRRRRCAVAVRAGDVAVVPRAAARLLDRLDIDGPAFTSIFQGATRWQTYVALAVSGQSVRRCRAGAGLGGDGCDHSARQCLQRRACSPITLRRKSSRPAPSS